MTIKTLLALTVNGRDVEIRLQDESYQITLPDGETRLRISEDITQLRIDGPRPLYTRVLLSGEAGFDTSLYSFKKGKSIEYRIPAERDLALIHLVQGHTESAISPTVSMIDVDSYGRYGLQHLKTERSEDVALVRPGFPVLGFLGDGISSLNGWDSREVARKYLETFFDDLRPPITEDSLRELIKSLQAEFNATRNIVRSKAFGLYYLAFLVDARQLRFVRLGDLSIFLLNKTAAGPRDVLEIIQEKGERENASIALGTERFANPTEIRGENLEAISDVLMMTDGAGKTLSSEEIYDGLSRNSGLGWFAEHLGRHVPKDDATAIRIHLKLRSYSLEHPDIRELITHSEAQAQQDLRKAIAAEINRATGVTADFDSSREALSELNDHFPQHGGLVDSALSSLEERHRDYQAFLADFAALKGQRNLDAAIQLVSKKASAFPVLKARLDELEHIGQELPLCVKAILDQARDFGPSEALATWDRRQPPELEDWIDPEIVRHLRKLEKDLSSIRSQAFDLRGSGNWTAAVDHLDREAAARPELKRPLMEISRAIAGDLEVRMGILNRAMGLLSKNDLRRALRLISESARQYPELFLEPELAGLKSNYRLIRRAIKEVSKSAASKERDSALKDIDRAIFRWPFLSAWLNPIRTRLEAAGKKQEDLRDSVNRLIQGGRPLEAAALLEEKSHDPDLHSLAKKELAMLRSGRKYSRGEREPVKTMRSPLIRRAFELVVIVLTTLAVCAVYLNIMPGGRERASDRLSGPIGLTVHADGTISASALPEDRDGPSRLAVNLFPEDFRAALADPDHPVRHTYAEGHKFISVWYHFLMTAIKAHIAGAEGEAKLDKAAPGSRLQAVKALLTEAARIWPYSDRSEPSPWEERDLLNYILRTMR